MTFLLFHGTEILSFMAGIVLGIAALPGIFIWVLNRPPAKPARPAILYFLLAVSSCTFFMIADHLNSDSLPDASVLLMLPVAVCFPWSVMIVVLSGVLDVDLGMGTLFLGGVLNAVLSYWVAKFARRRLDSAPKG